MSVCNACSERRVISNHCAVLDRARKRLARRATSYFRYMALKTLSSHSILFPSPYKQKLSVELPRASLTICVKSPSHSEASWLIDLLQGCPLYWDSRNNKGRFFPTCPFVMASPPATFLPVSSSSTYTSSFDPTSPNTYTCPERSHSPPRSRRPPSPKLHMPARALPRQSYRKPPFPYSLTCILTPRILSPILLWSFAIYLVHHYLLPLPLPALPPFPVRSPTASDHFLSTTFPPPPLREGDDSLDSVDPRYRPFAPLPPPDSPFPRLRPTRFLPPRCLEQWFADGETLCGEAELGEEEKLDATWLWVNGSDERWKESMLHWQKVESVFTPPHHFRFVEPLVTSTADTLSGSKMNLCTRCGPFWLLCLVMFERSISSPRIFRSELRTMSPFYLTRS